MSEKRRPGSMGDIERTFAHKRSATPPKGVEIIVSDFEEDELTPPPQMPPDNPDVESVLREHAQAIERVWDARNLRENVITIGKDVAAMAAMMSQFVMPAVKNVQGRLEVIERASEANRGKQDRFWSNEWPAAMKQLEAIGTHIERVEKDVGRVEKDVTRVEQQLGAFMKRSDERDVDVRAQLVMLSDHDERQEVRLRALEDFALTVKAKVALVSALVGGGGTGVVLWLKHMLGV